MYTPSFIFKLTPKARSVPSIVFVSPRGSTSIYQHSRHYVEPHDTITTIVLLQSSTKRPLSLCIQLEATQSTKHSRRHKGPPTRSLLSCFFKLYQRHGHFRPFLLCLHLEATHLTNTQGTTNGCNTRLFRPCFSRPPFNVFMPSMSALNLPMILPPKMGSHMEATQ